MARTTDNLQAVFQELLQDEINHLAKFCGFGQWLYTDWNFLGLSSLKNYQRCERNSDSTQVVKHLTVTITRRMRLLHWEFWSLTHKIELIYTFICVWQRMRSWSKTFTVEYLSLLFASSLISDNDLIEPTSIYF